MAKIHGEFKFDAAATNVTTPVMEFFEQKRGVCQDFTHLMISCLRSTGLAARYVSGYLLTRPAPGKPRRVGADVSHAWVSLFVPGNRLDRPRPDQQCYAIVGAYHPRMGPRLLRRDAVARCHQRRRRANSGSQGDRRTRIGQLIASVGAHSYTSRRLHSPLSALLGQRQQNIGIPGAVEIQAFVLSRYRGRPRPCAPRARQEHPGEVAATGTSVVTRATTGAPLVPRCILASVRK